MSAEDHKNPILGINDAPEGDPGRQAIDSLRGYAYQILAATLAWIDMNESGRLYLEVAEDYAIVINNALGAVQVKDTQISGSVTLNDNSIRAAIASYVDLVERNPPSTVYLRYLTTSEIGIERLTADRPAGVAGLKYWRKVAAGADPTPLRVILQSDKFPENVRSFVRTRDDSALRRDLLTRIHWDCGRPNFSALHQELEARLIVIGRERFDLPAQEARRLSGVLIHRALVKSIAREGRDRVLTRADLDATIDSATRLSIPRSAVNIFSRIASHFAASVGIDDHSPDVFSGQEGLIINGSAFPANKGMIQRLSVETAVAQALARLGAVVIVGGTGVGKSHVSRGVAAATAGEFGIVEFRDCDRHETRRRLDVVLAHIGGLASPLLILEDLNWLDDVAVASSAGRAIEGLRRRDRAVLITCYRHPSSRTLVETGLDSGCVIDCPYFSREEVNRLVTVNGGDPEVWAGVAYVAAAGHPQLTHAFVLGKAARGWPSKELEGLFKQTPLFDDINNARDAARRTLTLALTEDARQVLYRLSLTSWRFSRSLALTIAALPPSVPNSGECVDQLLGPWIEVVEKDVYQVSPLASLMGREMLTSEDQRRIHEIVALHMVKKRRIDLTDANAILTHALAGKSAVALLIFAGSVLRASSRTTGALAEFSLLTLFPTDLPIFPDDQVVSVALRLAQFKLAAAAGDVKQISGCVAAVHREANRLPEGEVRHATDILILSNVLATLGISNYLDEWIRLLHRFKLLIEGDSFHQELKANVERNISAGSNIFAVLFGIGSAGLSSVARLEHVIDELDGLDASERALFLTPVDERFSDYGVLINGPWVSQHGETGFDPLDAASRYARMAVTTEKWGIAALTVQCWVARAVMLDEYAKDMSAALAVLDEAEKLFPGDLVVARARAKIYRGSGQHLEALEILRAIAGQFAQNNPIERAFALREAAISAASESEWPQAEEWFLEAKTAANLAKTEKMRVVAIGLGVDAAVAALEVGKIGEGLSFLSDAVDALGGIDPNASLQAAYCHHVVRHTVLWALSHIRGNTEDGQRIAVPPGACSNPEPEAAFLQRPLGDLDVAHYLLAQAESAARLDLGLTEGLRDRLKGGPILAMEVVLRIARMEADIDKLEADRFAADFIPYLEAAIYHSNNGRRRKKFDPLSPERGQIPPLDKTVPFDSVSEKAGMDAIVAFGMRAALAGRGELIREIEIRLRQSFDGSFPASLVFDSWRSSHARAGQLNGTVVDSIGALLNHEHLEPFGSWIIGLRLFEHTNQSHFQAILAPYLSLWLRANWGKIINEESFRIYNPFQTVPPILAVLNLPRNDRRFVAALLLAASDAVGATLSEAARAILTNVAEEG